MAGWLVAGLVDPLDSAKAGQLAFSTVAVSADRSAVSWAARWVAQWAVPWADPSVTLSVDLWAGMLVVPWASLSADRLVPASVAQLVPC